MTATKPVTVNGKTHLDCIEQVLGAELQAGNVVFNGGYSWVIDQVTQETDRYTVQAHWSEYGINPNFFNKDMNMGLRADLLWTRVKAADLHTWRKIVAIID